MAGLAVVFTSNAYHKTILHNDLGCLRTLDWRQGRLWRVGSALTVRLQAGLIRQSFPACWLPSLYKGSRAVLTAQGGTASRETQIQKCTPAPGLHQLETETITDKICLASRRGEDEEKMGREATHQANLRVTLTLGAGGKGLKSWFDSWRWESWGGGARKDNFLNKSRGNAYQLISAS